MPFVLDKILQRVGYNNGYRSWLCREYMSAPYIPEENLYEVSRHKDNSILWSVQQMALDIEDGNNMFGQNFSDTATRYLGAYCVARVMISGGPDERISQDGKENVKCGICDKIGHNRRDCELNHQCPNCGHKDPVVIIQSLEPAYVAAKLNPFSGVPHLIDGTSYRCIFCKS